MITATEHRLGVAVFGTSVWIHGGPATAGMEGKAERAILGCTLELQRQHRALTRFEPTSELSALNADPRDEVPVSPLMAAFLESAIAAAELSDGLADPTLLEPLERAGYVRSLVGTAPASLSDAIEAAPPRRAARPDPAARWRTIEVDGTRGVVRRPPGLRIDSGGTGKGFAADRAASLLQGLETFAVDCGGDIAFGGTGGGPRKVEVLNPFDPENPLVFERDAGAVATSGLATRIWHTKDGFAHHLIDPSIGKPAWTGIVQATAFAPTASEAEAWAKMALLLGPGEASDALPHGGVVVADDESIQIVEAIG